MEPTKKCGITGKARETLARVLNHVLADECSLSATTRDYRWRVTGPNLYSLHRLFDEQRRQLDYWLEQVFDRMRASGLAAMAELQTLPTGGVPPAKPDRVEPRSLIRDLLARHEELARTLRDDIARLGDPATAQLLTRLQEFHETSAWMLRMVNDGPESSER
jgi:starvation-inducible DNA-binding protein